MKHGKDAAKREGRLYQLRRGTMKRFASKSRALLCSSLGAALLLSCSGPTNDGSGTKNVFGYDDREAMTSSAQPWSAIGKLSTGCTGTLIGRRLVLTAAH